MTAFAPQSILIQVHAETPSEAVVDCGIDLAKRHGATLKIVDVIPDNPWPLRWLSGGIERAIEQLTHGKADRLKAVVEQAAAQGVTATAKVLEAPSSVGIIREVMREGHDLVVRQARGENSKRAGFFGTTATRLLRKCPCPVLLLKPGHPWQAESVVAAVDATTSDEIHAELNVRIIEAAQGFCPDLRKLDVICAWALYAESVLKSQMKEEEVAILSQNAQSSSERQLDDLVVKFGMGIGWDNVRVLHGDAPEVIDAFVKKHNTDLLVLGTVARAGVSGILIGNTAEQILNRVECSVLAVKPTGFVSPITT